MPVACGHLLVLSSMRLPGAYGMWSSASAFLHEILDLPQQTARGDVKSLPTFDFFGEHTSMDRVLPMMITFYSSG